MSVPLPDPKQVSHIKQNLPTYLIIALTAAVVWLFVAFLDLNNYVRTDLLQRQIRNETALDANTRATESFLNYQRFVLPIRKQAVDTLP